MAACAPIDVRHSVRWVVGSTSARSVWTHRQPLFVVKCAHDAHGGGRRDLLRHDGAFVPWCIGRQAAGAGRKRLAWPSSDTSHRAFPETREIWSYGSGYGGNALLARSAWHCAFRRWDAMRLARRHMLMLRHARRQEISHLQAFPVSLGKTNFAMLIPPPAFAGWKSPRWARTSPGSSRVRTAAVRDNPARLLWRRAGTVGEDQTTTRWRCLHRTYLYHVALTDDGDVGGRAWVRRRRT